MTIASSEYQRTSSINLSRSRNFISTRSHPDMELFFADGIARERNARALPARRRKTAVETSSAVPVWLLKSNSLATSNAPTFPSSAISPDKRSKRKLRMPFFSVSNPKRYQCPYRDVIAYGSIRRSCSFSSSLRYLKEILCRAVIAEIAICKFLSLIFACGARSGIDSISDSIPMA